MSEQINVLGELYAKLEKLKTEAKAKQDEAKEVKDDIIGIMNELGRDEVIVSGLEGGEVIMSIEYPEREVLNKKELAQALGIKQQDLSKPQTMVHLSREGILTVDMIDKFTVTEERMQFSAKPYKEE